MTAQDTARGLPTRDAIRHYVRAGSLAPQALAAPLPDQRTDVSYSLLMTLRLPPGEQPGFVQRLLEDIERELSRVFGGYSVPSSSLSMGYGGYRGRSGLEHEPHIVIHVDGRLERWQTEADAVRTVLSKLQRALKQEVMYFGVDEQPNSTFSCLTTDEAEGLPPPSAFGPADVRSLRALYLRGRLPDGEAPTNIALGLLPSGPATLVGRENEIGLLNSAWAEAAIRILILRGSPGSGKSAILGRWALRRGDTEWADSSLVFAWTFAEQTLSRRVRPTDKLFLNLARELGLKGLRDYASVETIRVIAQAAIASGAVLLLDGLEAHQWPHSHPLEGELKDMALRQLLLEICSAAGPFCVITSRSRLRGFGMFEEEGLVFDYSLPPLGPSHGAELLRLRGVHGPERELQKASDEVKGHCLELVYLSERLRRGFGGDVTRRHELLTAGPSVQPTARVLLREFELAVAGGTALSLFRILSAFDEPLPEEHLLQLTEMPSLSTYIELASHDARRATLQSLAADDLLITAQSGTRRFVSLHSVVRDYFRAQLEASQQWRPLNAAIASWHLTRLGGDAHEDELSLQLAAIAHYCKAEAFGEALGLATSLNLFEPPQMQALEDAGLIGDLVAALFHFFPGGLWSRCPPGLDSQAHLLLLRELTHLLAKTQGYGYLPLIDCYRVLVDTGKGARLQAALVDGHLGLTRYHRIRAELVEAAKHAFDRSLDRVHLRLAKGEQRSTAALGLRARASCRFYQGRFVEAHQLAAQGARTHYSRKFALHLAQTDVNDPRISCIGYVALTSWFLGDLRRAQAWSRRAVQQAEDLGHSHTLAVAVYIEAMVAQLSGDYEQTRQSAGRQLGICKRAGIGLWATAAEFLLLWSDMLSGRNPGTTADAYRELLRVWTAQNARLFLPYWRALLAEGLIAQGHYDAAEEVLAPRVGDEEEMWYRVVELQLAAIVRRHQGLNRESRALLRSARRLASAQSARGLLARVEAT